MEFTVRATNPLVGHIIKDRHWAASAPTFTDLTALCGAKVSGRVPTRRYVCGMCVTLLIEDRNQVNHELDVADARVAILNDTLDSIMERIEPAPDIDEVDVVVPGDPERGGRDEPGTPVEEEDESVFHTTDLRDDRPPVAPDETEAAARKGTTGETDG